MRRGAAISRCNPHALYGAAVALATAVAYAPSYRGEFIWDDFPQIVENGLLRTWHGLWVLWTDVTVVAPYYPLFHTSFWIDFQLWGLNVVGYHVVNVALHVANAWLFVCVLQRLRVPGAWLAAALFALHPINVESVAWITERKNLLSTLFYLGALRVYLEHDLNRSSGRHRGLYFGSLVFFVLALLAKPVTGTLPGAILVIVWWRDGRIERRHLWDVLPMFVLGLGFGALSSWIEQKYTGARGPLFHLSAAEKILIAGRGVWFYGWKVLWPTNLSFIYPRWQIAPGALTQWLFPLGLVTLGLALRRLRARIGRGPLAVALLFAGSLLPALSVVPIYAFLFTFAANHWAYLASLWPCALVGCWGARLSARASATGGAWVLRAAELALVVALAALTFQQARTFVTAETLWRDTLVHNPDCWMCHSNLGAELVRTGQPLEAIEQFEAALVHATIRSNVYNDLANAYAQLGQFDRAIESYQRAFADDAHYAAAHNNLGNLYVRIGRLPDAEHEFQESVRISPAFAWPHYNLGHLLALRGDREAAAEHFRISLQTYPDNFAALVEWGAVLLDLGRKADAVTALERAAQLNPRSVTARDLLLRARQP